MEKTLFIFVAMMLMACQNNEKTLETKNLKLVENANNQEVRHYRASSVEKAIASLPFRLKLPEAIPNTYEQQWKLQFITDWNATSDGKDIAISLKTTSKEGNSGLGIYARDFDTSTIKRYKKDGIKITLENHQEVYYKMNNSYNDDWKSAGVYWISKGVFFAVESSSSNLDTTKIKQTLLELVNQMQ